MFELLSSSVLVEQVTILTATDAVTMTVLMMMIIMTLTTPLSCPQLFQTLFLSMSLVYDIMEWLERHESPLGRKLRYIKDVMFSGLVVPLTLVSLLT